MIFTIDGLEQSLIKLVRKRVKIDKKRFIFESRRQTLLYRNSVKIIRLVNLYTYNGLKDACLCSWCERYYSVSDTDTDSRRNKIITIADRLIARLCVCTSFLNAEVSE